MLLKGAGGAVAQLTSQLSIPGLPKMLFAILNQPLILSGIALQGMGFVVWIVVLSRESAGAALGLGGACVYLLTALAEWLIYGTRLGVLQYVALTMVSIGALLLTAVKA